MSHTHFAHNSTVADGNTIKSKSKWEPLFTPFGDGEDECQGKDCEKCRNLEPLHGHLNKVAFMAGEFAMRMFSRSEDRDKARQWRCLAGLWHDIGKFSKLFQLKLEGENISVEHAGAGAVHSRAIFKAHLSELTHHYPLAAAIAGHHAGLSNFRDQGCGHLTALLQRLNNNEPLTLDWNVGDQTMISDLTVPLLPVWCRSDGSNELSLFSTPFFRLFAHKA